MDGLGEKGNSVLIITWQMPSFLLISLIRSCKGAGEFMVKTFERHQIFTKSLLDFKVAQDFFGILALTFTASVVNKGIQLRIIVTIAWSNMCWGTYLAQCFAICNHSTKHNIENLKATLDVTILQRLKVTILSVTR